MAKRKKQPQAIEVLDGPTTAQLANGHYDRHSMPDPEGGNRVAQPHINRGGTPVMRWITSGRLTGAQTIAIHTCLRLWAICGLEQRTTANYGNVIIGGGDNEHRAAIMIEAKEDLYRIKDYIPPAYFAIFENVCRFDEPAGVAGGRLGYGNRSAEDRAHQVVCFVADIIAMNEGLVPVTRIW